MVSRSHGQNGFTSIKSVAYGSMSSKDSDSRGAVSFKSVIYCSSKNDNKNKNKM